MLRYCGKVVNILGATVRTTWLLLSTEASKLGTGRTVEYVKVSFVRFYVHMYQGFISPPDFANLPLGEHYLYPVSTPPITKAAKGN